MSRVCAEPGCGEIIEGRYCARHDKRLARYGGDWAQHSRERIAQIGQCMCELYSCHGHGSAGQCGWLFNLTVDHETDDVLCRPCHATREARRRQGVLVG